MDPIRHVFHRFAAAFREHQPSHRSQSASEPLDEVMTGVRAPRPGSLDTQNPLAGSAEAPPQLSAGTLKSPQFLGTEVEYFREARRILESAKPGAMVLLQMYEIENDQTNSDRSPATRAPAFPDQQALLPDLAAAAARGVKVEVILDASRDPRSQEIRNDPVMRYLQDAARQTGNITADYYPPETVNIDHAKELVSLTPAGSGYQVDEALTGGSNWGNHSPANDDGGGTFWGPDAVGAAQIFFRDQAFCRGDRSAPAVPDQSAGAALSWAATSPHTEGGGSAGIREAKLDLTRQSAAVYLNEFCLTHGSLVAATGDKGANAHVRLDPNEQHVNLNALQAIRDAGGEALWANTQLDPTHMPAQKNHEKLDVYVDGSGVPFALTMGSANDTANGLDGGNGVVRRSVDMRERRANHEIDVVMKRYTSPDGSYTTAPFLDAALAKTKSDLAQRSLPEPPHVKSVLTAEFF